VAGRRIVLQPRASAGLRPGPDAGRRRLPNGEAQRAYPYPRYSTSRLFLRQTFGLGGEREKVESDIDQLFGERDIIARDDHGRRYAVQDIFDNNAYANDPRVDFLNFSIWAAGAFDYAATASATPGASLPSSTGPYWSTRLGYFLEPAVSDTNVFDLALFLARRLYRRAGAALRALQPARCGPPRRLAQLRLRRLLQRCVALAAVSPGLSPNDTIALTHQGRTKYGFYLNLDQEIIDNVGAFARFSWNDGRTEIMSFTDITTSLSGGLSIKGNLVGPAQRHDRIAGAVELDLGRLATYLANGGLGIMIGDGALTYGSEVVAETYYSCR